MLCCIFFYRKMKRTTTNDVEQHLISLFNDSKKIIDTEKAVKAQAMLKRILAAFKVISIYDNMEHSEIVKMLYFNKNNINVLGVQKMAKKLFISERALYNLRKKYCQLAKIIMEE